MRSRISAKAAYAIRRIAVVIARATSAGGCASADFRRSGAWYHGCEPVGAPFKNKIYIKKGVYHYKSHEEASKHWEECILKGIAERQKEIRKLWKKVLKKNIKNKGE